MTKQRAELEKFSSQMMGEELVNFITNTKALCSPAATSLEIISPTQTIDEIIGYYSNVKAVNLHFNGVDFYGLYTQAFEEVFEKLAKKNIAVQELMFISCDSLIGVLQFLSSKPPRFTQLTKLGFTGTRLDNCCLELLPSAFANSKNLMHFDFPSQHLLHEQLSHILDVLQASNKLTTLDFNYSTIFGNEESIERLLNFLKKNHSLVAMSNLTGIQRLQTPSSKANELFTAISEELAINRAITSKDLAIELFGESTVLAAEEKIKRLGFALKLKEEDSLEDYDLLAKAEGTPLHKEEDSLEDYYDLLAKAEGTPLHSAVVQKDIETVKELIANGADVNARNKLEMMPLHLAGFFHGCTEIAEFLIKSGAEINAICSYLQPLHFAVYSGNADILPVLINAGADINNADSTLKTPLHIWASLGDSNPIIAQTLISYGANVNFRRDLYLDTALHNAVQANRTEAVELLLKAGADVNMSDSNLRMPLHYAIENKNIEIVRTLLDHGAYANLGFYFPKPSFLHIAVEANLTEIVKLLLKSGADVNSLNLKNQTPLHIAVEHNLTEIVELLLKSGANVNRYDTFSRTPYDIALNKEYAEIIQLFLDNPAAEQSHRTTHPCNTMTRAQTLNTFGLISCSSASASIPRSQDDASKTQSSTTQEDGVCQDSCRI